MSQVISFDRFNSTYLLVLAYYDMKLIQNASFDEVYLPFVLRQGALQWVRARVISEDISIMGNGMVSMRDGHLSVTRLVVSPEVASMLAQGMRNMGIIGDRDS